MATCVSGLKGVTLHQVMRKSDTHKKGVQYSYMNLLLGCQTCLNMSTYSSDARPVSIRRPTPVARPVSRVLTWCVNWALKAERSGG